MTEGNGRNAVTEEIVTILRRMDERLDRGFSELRGEVREINARLGRIEHVIETAGTAHRDHEARLLKLETTVARIIRPAARRAR